MSDYPGIGKILISAKWMTRWKEVYTNKQGVTSTGIGIDGIYFLTDNYAAHYLPYENGTLTTLTDVATAD